MGIFRTSVEKKLQKRYTRLMEEAYKLSHSNRRLSDEKYTEANHILGELQAIRVEAGGR